MYFFIRVIESEDVDSTSIDEEVENIGNDTALPRSLLEGFGTWTKRGVDSTMEQGPFCLGARKIHPNELWVLKKLMPLHIVYYR
jgi:hypothetical protein